MEDKTKLIPPNPRNADLVATGTGAAVIMIKDDAMWVYELGIYGQRGIQRTTPTVLVGTGPQANLVADLMYKWPGVNIRLTKTPLSLKLVGDRRFSCPCGLVATGNVPCKGGCQERATKCTHCAMPVYTTIRCQYKHCQGCCDCWYRTCGCTAKYEHDAEPPTHFYWSFGDTQHEALACGQCTAHCACFACSCGKLHQQMGKTAVCNLCKSTTHITDCCSKPDAKYAITRDQRLTFRNYASPVFNESKTFIINECARFMSPEIEVANINPRDWRYISAAENTFEKMKIPIVPDASIPDGFELNVQPANGDLFVTNVQKICKALDRLKPYITDRCGLHVHVDARDFSVDDLAKMLRLFVTVEPLVYNLIDQRRRKAKYCVTSKAYARFANPRLDIENLKTFLYGGGYDYHIIKQKQRKNTSTIDVRYRGLNLHSFFYRGTLEFRHHHGSVDAFEIADWAMFCGFLLDAAKAADWKWLSEMPDKIATPTGFDNSVVKNLPATVPNLSKVPLIIKRLFKRYVTNEALAAELPEAPAARAPRRQRIVFDQTVVAPVWEAATFVGAGPEVDPPEPTFDEEERYNEDENEDDD